MYVWYSESTKESGQLIAQALECEHGTLPPKDYEGDVFCFGAAPADGFKWDARKFGKIINDPRTFRKFADKKEVAKVLGDLIGVPIRMFMLNGHVVATIRTDTGVATPTIVTGHQDIFVSLGKPPFFALDGVIKGATFIPTNVVFGPSLTSLPAPVLGQKSVVGSLAEAFKEDDKAALQKLVNEATPAEASALRNLLKRLAGDETPKAKKIGK